MTSDLLEVEKAVRLYLDALHRGDVEGLARTFAPTSALYASTDGEATALEIKPWLERVRNRKSAHDSGYQARNEIHAIDVEGDMATAKVSSEFPPKRFVDFLSLVRTKDGWRIVSKTYVARDIPPA